MRKAIFSIVLLLNILSCREQHIFHSYFGTVDIDTLQCAFDDFCDKEPCYIVHTDIVDGDTIKYYFYPWKGIHYRDMRDSKGRVGIVQWEPNINIDYDSLCFHYLN